MALCGQQFKSTAKPAACSTEALPLAASHTGCIVPLRSCGTVARPTTSPARGCESARVRVYVRVRVRVRSCLVTATGSLCSGAARMPASLLNAQPRPDRVNQTCLHHALASFLSIFTFHLSTHLLPQRWCRSWPCRVPASSRAPCPAAPCCLRSWSLSPACRRRPRRRRGRSLRKGCPGSRWARWQASGAFP
jgi:hypothetical protein